MNDLDVLALAFVAQQSELRSLNARMHVLEVALSSASWDVISVAEEEEHRPLRIVDELGRVVVGRSVA